jgi:protein gp37
MKDFSKIQWTHYTGGPWMICDPVSPGCANCYAWELMENRLGGGENSVVRKAYKAAGFEDWKTRPVWGKTATRVLTKGFWRDALRLNKQAGQKGERYRMFPSMIDWLDEMPAGIIDQEDGKKLEPIQVLADFLDIIRRTPNLDWLLLTKRPENWRTRLEAAMDYELPHKFTESSACLDFINAWLRGYAPANVWIGVTCENQEYADTRIPELLKIPAVCRFISYEPALGPVDFTPFIGRASVPTSRDLNWIIVGGESGSKARQFEMDWARSTIDQCKAAGVPCFVKQMGAKPSIVVSPHQAVPSSIIKDKKGGDMAEWPEDLRVREFPNFKSQIPNLK